MTSEIIQIVSNVIGFGAAGIASFRWYNRYQRAVFSQEREIEHLKKQSLQFSNQLVEADKKLDDLTVIIVEMRGAIGLIIKDFGVTNRAVNLPTFGSLEETKGGKNYG
jgi:uncharacterized protein YeeX (DUF496 family)